MLLTRDITVEISRASQHFPVIVLTGARQAGKTTVLQMLFPQYSYVSLELPSLAEQAERDPESFISAHPLPLIIDEVQYAPGLFRQLKSYVDRHRHEYGQLILTGSQHFVLMKNISESLAGRVAVLELENLSLHELYPIVQYPETYEFLKTFIVRGQFPELWRNRGMPVPIFYSSYLATYLERDVRQILNVTSLRDFERFIRILALRSGSILNKSDIAKEVGVSVKAIGDWISVLQASGQIILLEPWFSSFGKRIVRSPKVYFRDTGLLAFLLGVDESTLDASPFRGMLFETLIFSELRKTSAFRTGASRLWYYRDQYAREIDFIIEQHAKLSFMEVKWTPHPDTADVKTMHAIQSELSKSSAPWETGGCFVICRTPHQFPLEDGTRVVPFHHARALMETS